MLKRRHEAGLTRIAQISTDQFRTLILTNVSGGGLPWQVYRVTLPISTGLGAGEPASVGGSVIPSCPWVMLPMRVALALGPVKARWVLPPPRPPPAKFTFTAVTSPWWIWIPLPNTVACKP